jgi:hypothetical protein
MSSPDDGGCAAQYLFDPIQQSQRGGLRERRPRSPLEQPARGSPLREDDGIRHWGTICENSAGRFDVRAAVKQRIE